MKKTDPSEIERTYNKRKQLTRVFKNVSKYTFSPQGMAAQLQPGPELIKLFSCSTHLSTKFQLLIKTKIPKSEELSCFKSLISDIKHANKC